MSDFDGLVESLHTWVDAEVDRLRQRAHRKIDELARLRRGPAVPGSRICIDPGHGGTDPGAVAHRIEEKRLVLRYARQLGQILEKRGHAVKMTRVADELIPILERPVIANEWGADVFVSIHANASANPEAHGAWVLHDDLTQEGAGIALAHRIFERMAQVPGAPDADPEPEVYPDDSPWTGGRDLAVLGRTKMPAVLVELGFLTNQEDALELLDGDFRAAACRAIADGIEDWLRERGKRVSA